MKTRYAISGIIWILEINMKNVEILGIIGYNGNK